MCIILLVEEWKVVITESNWLPALLGLKDHDLLKRGADITVLVLSSGVKALSFVMTHMNACSCISCVCVPHWVSLCFSSDSCMKKIMDEGNVVQLAKRWMEESDSLYLKATGALFIANMARSGWLHMVCAADC